MKRITRILIFAITLFFSMRILSSEAVDKLFQITVPDVGKGDCILIQTGENTVMIDTGYKQTAEGILRYLKEHGIEKLDALIISHFHKDHVGGAAAILQNIPADVLYLPDYEGTRDVYQEMLAVIKEKGLWPQRLTEAVSFQLNGAEYSIYPSSVAYDPDMENDNDVSMSVFVRYNGHTALFAGDLEEAGISSLSEYAKTHGLDLKCDILKLPHHGRTSDNSAVLLDLASPGIALITDGSSQRAYGEMIDELDKRGCKYLCSAVDGTYIVKAAGTSDYSIETPDAKDHKTSGPWKYRILEDGTVSITDYTGNDKNLVIPSEIDGYTVSGIGDSAFYNQTKLKSVTVPESVTVIGDSAFSWCTGMTEISIPESVLSIGSGAFAWCKKLETPDLPDGLNSIGEYTFFHCKDLNNIVIPDSVTYIGEKAFSHCSALEQITIPSSVKTMEEEAFKKCRSLKTVIIQPGLKTIKKSMFEDCESLESITIPETVTSIKASVFNNCSSLTDIYYGGTREMWEAVEKGKNWDTKTPDGKTIHFLGETEDPPVIRISDNPFFRLQGLPADLPSTGIASASVPTKPQDPGYKELGLSIEIPSIASKAEIVGVPFVNNDYPVAGLGSFAGALEGFALPGKGASVIVGHNHLGLQEAGPFAMLKFAAVGDRIFIQTGNDVPVIYSVFANEKIGMSDWAALEAISGPKENVLILMTCEDERSGGLYENRRIIAAEPLRH